MWEAALGILKNLAVKLATGIVAKAAGAARNVTDRFAGGAAGSRKQKKTGKKKKRSKVADILFMLVGAASCLVGMLTVVVFAAAALPVVLISVLTIIFQDNMDLTNLINKYWNTYRLDYGTVWEIENVTEAKQLGFLIEQDDFWEEAQGYFVFDRESMELICTYAADSDYYAAGTCTTEVQAYTLSGGLLEAERDEERLYEVDTPVYVCIEDHGLPWQVLYALLAGSTQSSHLSEEQISELASELIKIEEEEGEEESEEESICYSWTQLGYLDAIEEGPFPVNGSIEQYYGEQTRALPDFFILSGIRRSSVLLTYVRRCPVLTPSGTVTVWDGVIQYGSDGSMDFTESADSILDATEALSITLDTDRVISCAMDMPDGYRYAITLSGFISDGTLSVSGSSELEEFLSGFAGQEDLISELLSAFGIRIQSGRLSSGNTDYSEYVSRSDHGSYCIIRQYKNGPDVYWWSQNQYDNDYYGAATIHAAGCGPTSLAIVYSSLTGDIWTPPEAAAWCCNHGYIANRYNASATCGTASIFSQGAEELGLRVDYYGTGADAFRQALTYLDEGDLIVCNVGRNASGNPIFSGQGHFLVVRGLTDDNQILLADPGTSHIEKNLTPFDISDMEYILERSSVGNVGKVWAIGYDGERIATDADWGNEL